MKILQLALMIILPACTTTVPKVNNIKMADGYYMKGLSYLQEKNLELALVEFERSIQTDNKNIKSYYALGIVNDMQGKPKEAETYFLKSIDIDSNFSEAYNALGVVYSKQEKWNDALKMFNRALENKLYTTPHYPYLNIGDLYMARKEYDKAVDAYRDSKRYAQYTMTIYKLGTALFEAGKIKESISEFKEGLSLAPGEANLHYGLALAFLKEGDKKAALAEFRKTAELAPQSDLARKAKDYIITLR